MRCSKLCDRHHWAAHLWALVRLSSTGSDAFCFAADSMCLNNHPKCHNVLAWLTQHFQHNLNQKVVSTELNINLQDE